MAIDPYANCNPYIEDNNLCTLETCCLAQSSFLYIPDFGGNLFFTIWFAILLIPQLYLGIRYKTWGFMGGMLSGLILEVIGYAARIMLNDNPFNGDAFLMYALSIWPNCSFGSQSADTFSRYLICLTIAPVFLTAAIYLTLSRLIALYNPSASRLRPRTIALFFMTSDFLSLVLQAIGGAIADTATEEDAKQSGINTMIAGLFLQVVSLILFLSYCLDFAIRLRGSHPPVPVPEKQAVRNTTLFKVFLASLLLATVAILIRSIFRVAELWEGFSGKLWNDEVDFMILDGAMVGLACLLLCIWHPGPAFGQQWGAADWSLRKGGRAKEEALRVEDAGEPKEMRRMYDGA